MDSDPSLGISAGLREWWKYEDRKLGSWLASGRSAGCLDTEGLLSILFLQPCFSPHYLIRALTLEV